ncbi:hypothetical protein KI387_031063 [Taxus chinensis]|uniref:Mitochondrial carrier protein n=1 Tax=Taxus chinensis TaxID=29808 RepID=A0AA38FFK5_TAXCH|nr:hypothetical protein KI387_031063 [Taxus chinensis]
MTRETCICAPRYAPGRKLHKPERTETLFNERAVRSKRGKAKMGSDVAKDLMAGTVGGAAQIVCGHPFDTIKVKLQSQIRGQYAGATDALTKTIAQQGFAGLYRGMGAPLATVAALNALLFTTRGQMEVFLRFLREKEPGDPAARLSASDQVICGAGAGAAVSFVACPTELIKCRLQAHGGGSVTGPLDVARRVLTREGGFVGFFKGLTPTLCREAPGNAIMFGTYEWVKRWMAGRSGCDVSELGRGAMLTAGGLAGAAPWIFIYPADVVKSVIQVDDFSRPKYSGSIDAFKKIMAGEGVRGFYKGFGPALMRSVPANAACFLAYEITREALA